MYGEQSTLPLDNEHLARRLEEIGDLLEKQRANPFRVEAYRRAAGSVRQEREPIHQLLARGGLDRLQQLPGIGGSLARTMEQLVHTDHVDLLERLRGGHGSSELLATVPGIGPRLAQRIHEELGIESLAELEVAAYDGRLARVPGMGERRIKAVCETLAGRFRRRPRSPESHHPIPREHNAAVAELLDIDREYREKAARDELPKLAPFRFNPTGEAWLPVLHTRRENRHYTALFSNTARAHELGTLRDWVVLYRDDVEGDGQWTVVTASSGALRGKRIVRGLENACRLHYGV